MVDAMAKWLLSIPSANSEEDHFDVLVAVCKGTFLTILAANQISSGQLEAQPGPVSKNTQRALGNMPAHHFESLGLPQVRPAKPFSSLKFPVGKMFQRFPIRFF